MVRSHLEKMVVVKNVKNIIIFFITFWRLLELFLGFAGFCESDSVHLDGTCRLF